MSQCSVVLPFLDPIQNRDYFPHGKKKLSGFIPQAIAYRIPTLLHTELHSVHRHGLTAPSLPYNDTASLTVALEKILQLVVSKPGTIQGMPVQLIYASQRPVDWVSGGKKKGKLITKKKKMKKSKPGKKKDKLGGCGWVGE